MHMRAPVLGALFMRSFPDGEPSLTPVNILHVAVRLHSAHSSILRVLPRR